MTGWIHQKSNRKAFKMLPGPVGMKVAVSWEFPQLCRAPWPSGYSSKKESVKSTYVKKSMSVKLL